MRPSTIALILLAARSVPYCRIDRASAIDNGAYRSNAHKARNPTKTHQAWINRVARRRKRKGYAYSAAGIRSK